MSDNTHAAMCVYCGEAIIYDTREVTDMAAAHAKIVEHDQQCDKNPLVIKIAVLEALIKQARRHRDESSDKCDALAAHVGEMTRLWLNMDDCEQGSDEQEELIAQMFEAIRDHHNEPTTSLARRDAQIKADALSRFISVYLSPGLAHNRATGELQALRKEAEGHQ